MPYIKQEIRSKLNKINEISDNIETEGELNYVLTNLCLNYINKKGKSYKEYNAVIGVLECAKLEFYRRAVAEYENFKIMENGDVYKHEQP